MTAPQPRYFYTDALAAAWMAKHFGMQFEEHDNGFEFFGDYVHHLCNQDGERLYIHLDSLHLLEPNGATDLTEKGIWSATSSKPFEGENRIIQRNGIAFHWPESETA